MRAPVGVLIVNESGQIVFANRYLQKLFSRRVIDQIPEIIMTKLTPESPSDQMFKIDQYQFWVRKIGVKSEPGTVYWYFIPAKLVDVSTPSVPTGTIDLPDMESLKTMARGLAHEFKNPITSIKMLLEMMSKDQRPAEDVAQQLKGILSFEVERLDRILADFLNFADIGPMAHQPENVMDIIAEVEQIVHQTYPSANFTLSKEIFPVPKIVLDRKKIIQVLLNLVINAVEVLPSYGGHIGIELRKQADAVSVMISNDGEGISAQALPKLFLPFYSMKQDGTGLGLAISQRIVMEHGSKISCESEPGPKTVFHIKLPLQRTWPESDGQVRSESLSRNPTPIIKGE